MFTGLVETVGEVTQAEGAAPLRLTVRAALPLTEIVLGESIAIDGCCLTVVQASADGLVFEAATETLQRTTLGKLRPGARVNLERALRFGDRLGGHLVAGHVDGVGTVHALEQIDSALYMSIAAPQDLAPLLAPRGSVTVAGVSLTVTAVRGAVFTVALIPHTLAVTTLKTFEVGDPVNLEADLLARYVERLLAAKQERSQP